LQEVAPRGEAETRPSRALELEERVLSKGSRAMPWGVVGSIEISGVWMLECRRLEGQDRRCRCSRRLGRFWGRCWQRLEICSVLAQAVNSWWFFRGCASSSVDIG
jgi:hypothetical protein